MSRRLVQEILPADPADHPAARALRRLVPTARRPEAIEILKLTRSCGVYRLVGAAADGTNIIAKRDRPRSVFVERIVYEELLPHLGAPALGCHGSLEEAQGAFWIFIEDAGDGGYAAVSRDDRVLAGEWLAVLHAVAARGAGGPLEALVPDRGPGHYRAILATVRRVVDDNLDNPSLPEEDRSALAALANDCAALEARWPAIERICARGPRTIVHGDLVEKNVRVRRGAGAAALLVFDWENAGWGVPAADLAPAVGGTVSPDLDTYGARARGAFPGTNPATLRDVAACGVYFRILDSMNWVVPEMGPHERRFLARPMACLRIYQARLREALDARGWS